MAAVPKGFEAVSPSGVRIGLDLANLMGNGAERRSMTRAEADRWRESMLAALGGVTMEQTGVVEMLRSANERLRELEADERLVKYAAACVDVNAPLALEQVAMKTEANLIRMLLGLPGRLYHGRD